MFSITFKSKHQPQAIPKEEASPPPRLAALQPGDDDTFMLEPTDDEYGGVEIEEEERTDKQLMK